MLCAFRTAFTCCALFFLPAGPAEARRVALVIGEAPFLASPVTDAAAAVADALRGALKTGVALDGDAALDHFLPSIYRLLREAEGAEGGVFFGTGARALACSRGGIFGEEGSCATFYFSH
jgi:hypothetical protein